MPITIYPSIRSAFLRGDVGTMASGMDLALQILDVSEPDGIGVYDESHVFLSDFDEIALPINPIPMTGIGWSAFWQTPVTIAEVTATDVVLVPPLGSPNGKYGAAAIVFWTGDPETTRLVAYWSMFADSSGVNLPANTFIRIEWNHFDLGRRVFTI